MLKDEVTDLLARYQKFEETTIEESTEMKTKVEELEEAKGE